MMAAQRVATSRAGGLLRKKYYSPLPRLARTSGFSLPCYFSTSTRPGVESSGDDKLPPRKRHPQSFVSSDPNLELGLGELEEELPPSYYQDFKRRDRGPWKPRHAKDGKDSYWRPPWRNPRAQIISAEDFANRPRVSFSESFASLHDAMGVMSWLGQDDKNNIYQLYVELMTSLAAGKNRERGPKNESWGVLTANTSHEYVVRVVAQKFNISTTRAAGVIQLQHNEEQLKKDPNFQVNHSLQTLVDEKVQEEIREVYRSYGETDPLQFVEDPMHSSGAVMRQDTGSPNQVKAPELTDVNALMRKTRMKELENAKVRIANHIYVEDIDERTRKVKVDKEVRRLLKMKADMESLYEDMDKIDDKKEGNPKDEEEGKKAEKQAHFQQALLHGGDIDDAKEESATEAILKSNKRPKDLKIPKGASPYPENNRGHNGAPQTRRPRWKYVAQIINTRMMENPPGLSRRGKKVAKRAKHRRHGRIVDGNTVIEQDGKLRVASVAELEQTSWKHVRNESEFVFRGVKEAWLKRQLEGEVGGWGYQEEVFKPEKLDSEELDNTKEEGEDEAVDGQEESDARNEEK